MFIIIISLHLKIILLFVGKILYLCFHKNKMLTAMKRKYLLFYILLLFRSIPVSAGWQRPVTNYTRHTYKAGNQNWSIQQLVGI